MTYCLSFDAAKLRTISITSKFWSSKCKENLFFSAELWQNSIKSNLWAIILFQNMEPIVWGWLPCSGRLGVCMNIRINTQHRFTVSKRPFYCQRKAVSLVAKRPFTTSTLKVHIHSNTCLWVVHDVLSTRSAVIFRSFLSQFWGVKWLGNGRKVTLLRVEDDFGATRRWRCLQQILVLSDKSTVTVTAVTMWPQSRTNRQQVIVLSWF